ncbi:LysR family transcriptional regulator [Litoreibacter roseus]|uniref:LysR family transcriptional regulator n=1 Tax=Litoreibacter roseus TaxID=2601869 RepID=UPI0013573B47
MNDRAPVADPIRWDDLAAFLAVARAGGLAAAAKDVVSSAPTLGRRMRELERRMGRELFSSLSWL